MQFVAVEANGKITKEPFFGSETRRKYYSGIIWIRKSIDVCC